MFASDRSVTLLTALFIAFSSTPSYAGGIKIKGAIGAVVSSAANSIGQAGDRLKHGDVAGTVTNLGQAIGSVGSVNGVAIAEAGRSTRLAPVARAASLYASTLSLNGDALATGVTTTGIVMEGGDPRQVLTLPLAAALRHARNAHLSGSRPLPPQIKDALRGIVPDVDLERARYTEGELQITLSNSINRIQRAFGDNHAVTVDDSIVFRQTPSLDPENVVELRWWAHELFHVAQYRRLGFEGFALRYTENFRALENEAEQLAQAVGQLDEDELTLDLED